MQSKLTIRYYILKVVLIIIMLVSLFPFYIMIIGSIKPSTSFLFAPIDLNPVKNFTLINYGLLSVRISLLHAYYNSILVSSIVIFSVTSMSMLAGYVFYKREFLFKKALYAIVIITMMLPRQLLLIPNFMLAKQLNLINTIIGTALTTISASYGIFLTRQFVRAIPKDYYDAAYIDGCGEIKNFILIVLPMLKPVALSIIIFTLFNVWNDYLWQNIMLTGANHRTVPTALAYLVSLSDATKPTIGLQMAGSVLAAFPILLLFFIFQKYFIKGVSVGGIKE